MHTVMKGREQYTYTVCVMMNMRNEVHPRETMTALKEDEIPKKVSNCLEIVETSLCQSVILFVV